MIKRLNWVIGLVACGVYLLGIESASALLPSRVTADVAANVVNNRIAIDVTCRIWGSNENEGDTIAFSSVTLRRASVADSEPRNFTEIANVTGGFGWTLIRKRGDEYTAARRTLTDPNPPSGELLYTCTYEWAQIISLTEQPRFTLSNADNPVSAYRATAPTEVPTGLTVTDAHAMRDEVTLSWTAVPGTPAGLGRSNPTGYEIGRRPQGGAAMNVIGTVSGTDTTTFTDAAPSAGHVTYAVRVTTQYTEWFPNAPAGWATEDATIPPLDLDLTLTPPPPTVSQLANGDDWELQWDQLTDDRRYRPFHFQVWAQTEDREFTQLGTVRGIPTATTYRVPSPQKGRRYNFYVVAARDTTGFRAGTSSPSNTATFGTETRPTIWEGEQSPGQLTIHWHPGPDNGNGSPPDDLRWFVQYWPMPHPGPDRLTTIREFGDANTRSFVLRYYDSQQIVGEAQPAQDFVVRVAAVNRAGVGLAAQLTTSPIASTRTAPQAGDVTGSAMQTQPGRHSSRTTDWWIEGLTQLSPGDRAVYTLYGKYTDNSGDPLAGLDRYSVNPVGVREPTTNNRGVRDLTNEALGCNEGEATDNHKVCLQTTTEERNEGGDLTGPKLIQYNQPQETSAGYLAYRVDGDGVPFEHKIHVEVRHVAAVNGNPNMAQPFFGERFQVGIGVTEGSDLLLQRNDDSQYLDVTIVPADPLPPTGLRVTTATDDPTMWRLDWGPPVNGSAANVDAYRVYRRRGGTGEFTQPTDTEYAMSGVEVPKPDEPMLEEFHVVAINSADAMSAPSEVARIGLPYPPRTVVATVTSGGVDLRWNAPTAAPVPITGYRVEVSVRGRDEWATLTESTTETQRRYTSADVPPARQLHYRVRSLSAVGPSAPSTVVRAAVPAAGMDPPVRLLTAANADGTSVTLSWLKPQHTNHASIVGYRIERRADGATNWTELVENTGRARTVYVDESAELDGTTTFHYRVTARTASGLQGATRTDRRLAITFDDPTADINADGTVDADDAAILYHALAHRQLLGNGSNDGGGFGTFRGQLLEEYIDRPLADDGYYQQLLAHAWAWQRSAIENGGDLNQDSVVDATDALILYYSRLPNHPLGTGAVDSGNPALRQTFLRPLAQPFNGDEDVVLRGMIMQARAIIP